MSDKKWELLRAPTPPNRIEFKVGSGKSGAKRAMVLSYMDARFVEDRLDEVMGAENWSASFSFLEWGGKPFVSCKLTVMGVEKQNVGSHGDKDPMDACSHAFKRVASHGFGIGRDLYDSPDIWLKVGTDWSSHIRDTGRSLVITDDGRKEALRIYMAANAKPAAKKAPQKKAPAKKAPANEMSPDDKILLAFDSAIRELGDEWIHPEDGKAGWGLLRLANEFEDRRTSGSLTAEGRKGFVSALKSAGYLKEM